MTKYILHGGNSSHQSPDNDSFFAEMTKGLEGKVHILLNYFSRKDDEVERCAEQDKVKFLENSVTKNLQLEIADENNLAEQLERCDVFYMRGGETAKLVEKMRKTPNVEKLFQGKVVGGSSAGVYVLGKYYWENDIGQLGEGLGIFDLKTFCHYTHEDKEIVEKLLAHGEDLPLLTLPNYKWVVMYR